MDTPPPLFRSPADLAAEHASFTDWPPAERLLLRCQSVFDVAADGMAVEAVLLRERLFRVVERASRRGIISEPQAWVMRQALKGEPS